MDKLRNMDKEIEDAIAQAKTYRYSIILGYVLLSLLLLMFIVAVDIMVRDYFMLTPSNELKTAEAIWLFQEMQNWYHSLITTLCVLVFIFQMWIMIRTCSFIHKKNLLIIALREKVQTKEK